MKHVVFDSYALIALFRKEDGFEFVRDVLIKLSEGELTGSISVINVGEIYYMVSRKSNVKKAELAISALLQFPIEIIDAGFDLTLEAAKLKSRYKLSYADAFAGAISISQKATLITGDQEFNNLKAEKGFQVHFI
ncbi:MAG: type II toxin-antitoxin system VapC family toxin [Pedobacter sp.]|jgi:predicted nucleic acid-binding protein